MRVIIKTSEELDKIRESGRVLGIVHKELQKLVEPGITTNQLAKVAEEIISDNEATPSFKGYRDFPYSICASLNEQIVHGFPNDRVLKDGDVLSVDCGVYKNGYHADAAFTTLIGSTHSDSTIQLYNTTNECLDLVIKAIKSGITTGTIGSIIQAHALHNGFSVIENYIGHGIGRDLHEYPAIPNYGRVNGGTKLLSGAVIAVEPMLVGGGNNNKTLADGWTVVTEDSSLATHVEKTIIVNDNGCEVVTVF